jgi:dTDP-4-amino-4,6-dideoxygalactose transaminase
MTVSLNPFGIIEQFERAICDYTHAPYCIAVNSCTNALFLSLMWYRHKNLSPLDAFGPVNVFMPRRTYPSVPMQVIHAGMKPAFVDHNWTGEYELAPLNIWDSARRFTGGMYRPGAMQACSFHWLKPLGISHGGCILHDNPNADEFLRRARFDGRLSGESSHEAKMIGWHCLTTPEIAAAGLVRLSGLPYNNPDSPKPEYPNLSAMDIFQ